MSTVGTQHEPCEECGAPLDPQQRYCVNCAARRGNGANPSSRYFATMSQRARRPAARPPAKAGPGSRAAAVGFFALLPLAVAIGVVVGRTGSGGGNDEALLEALRRQQQSVASTAAPGTESTTKAGRKSSKSAKSAKGSGKVIAHTSNGDVHQVTGYKPSEKVVDETTKLVEENPAQTGKTYITAQQNLPDVVPIK